MDWLTEDAALICDHGGQVTLDPRQGWVRIETRRVLIAEDPETRSINACPNVMPVIGLRPCLNTLRVGKGYSGLVRIGGRPVCLESVRGLTDGSPPGAINYRVVDPGQSLLSAGA